MAADGGQLLHWLRFPADDDDDVTMTMTSAGVRRRVSKRVRGRRHKRPPPPPPPTRHPLYSALAESANIVTVAATPVSYTHLTLPTILRV